MKTGNKGKEKTLSSSPGRSSKFFSQVKTSPDSVNSSREVQDCDLPIIKTDRSRIKNIRAINQFYRYLYILDCLINGKLFFVSSKKKESNTNSVIKIKNVNKTFYQGEFAFPVLNDISFEIAEKKLVTLMGPSGSGKSTLLNILSAIESADSGEVNVFGHQLFGADEKELTIYRRKTIGIVFQFFHLFPYLSATENVALPLYLSGTAKNIAVSKAKEALFHVGLKHRLEFTPKEMSGGEKQRVSIARALVHKPKLILADEPTGNLDSKSSEIIMKLFHQCVHELGISVFLVTHNEQIGESGDINLRMLDGKIQKK